LIELRCQIDATFGAKLQTVPQHRKAKDMIMNQFPICH